MAGLGSRHGMYASPGLELRTRHFPHLFLHTMIMKALLLSISLLHLVARALGNEVTLMEFKRKNVPSSTYCMQCGRADGKVAFDVRAGSFERKL